jgi:glycosyltransferase involved in cell wall biosynthesis
MVIVSCSTKLHAFNLAEQLDKHGLLDTFYTTYAYQKNKIARRLIKRIDHEVINPLKIDTNILVGVLHRKMSNKYQTNEWFDKSVAAKIKKGTRATVFIGWSAMSWYSMQAFRKYGKLTILERGSTHIQFQDAILQEEYKKFNIAFKVDPAVIKRELQEYELANYISIPSMFVKKTFIDYGVPAEKLLVNPYGVSHFFTAPAAGSAKKNKKFTVVYLGTLSIRKGLVYLFEALQQLTIPPEKMEVWFIGSIEKELQPSIEKYKKDHWHFLGHIDHYRLLEYLAQCDAGVQCSLEEGLSMVIPQLMSCHIPVIVTPNSGGGDIVQDNVSGFIVPVRSPAAIAEKIDYLYHHEESLKTMKQAAGASIQTGFTWNDYGNRYVDTLNKL